MSYPILTEIKERLDAGIKSSGEVNFELGTIQEHVKEIRQGIAISSLSSEAKEQLKSLLVLTEVVYAKVAQERVLKALDFPDKYVRVDAIEKAHSQTFDWIYTDSKRHNENSQSFVKWLATGSGTYHISGKLGSGKSTLMKFLRDHKRTREELQKWAGPGQECPDMIPTVLPDLWKQVTSLPWQASANLQFRAEDARLGFARLLQCRNVYDEHCFCFLIDGLDEYQETHQEDYKAMIELLSDWTSTAPSYVKLCVASREYNVFLNFFDKNKRLRLQDLTRDDMEHYILDRLEASKDKETEDLVPTIVEKANGIFLWVTLVLKSIRARLEDGYSLAIVAEEVKFLPTKLESLFRYLLDSITQSSLKKASQTFSMVNLYQSNKFDFEVPRLDFLSYSFLDEYAEGKNMALINPFPWSETDEPAVLDRKQFAHKRLNGHCKGFLESDENGNIFVEDHGGEISLIKLIEYCDFNNKNEVIELLRSNTTNLSKTKGPQAEEIEKDAAIDCTNEPRGSASESEARPHPNSNRDEGTGAATAPSPKWNRFRPSFAQLQPLLIFLLGKSAPSRSPLVSER
ncbi:hypothetical protein BKA67DRAFT_694764 [Truncatella angustata]|uniref:Nephrocystin 3-like N-terminal domain-containing protein n=1 Tax=Truncatella angustata TaxID=152316 RepID=A0A9P8RP37_9PEZI|nr:uncharacterized protein BKA67DRAFT_694764 [Truncatella angustata]KAH6647760.1 hypothetical protein BKA67DRAFT_694764 [Truncatella angustata]